MRGSRERAPPSAPTGEGGEGSSARAPPPSCGGWGGSADTRGSEPERRERDDQKSPRHRLPWRPEDGRRSEVKPSWERTARRRFSNTDA